MSMRILRDMPAGQGYPVTAGTAQLASDSCDCITFAKRDATSHVTEMRVEIVDAEP